MMGRTQTAQEHITNDTGVDSSRGESPLLLDFVGGVVFHATEEMARQVMQILKQAIVDVPAIDYVEAARLDQAPPLGPLRAVASRPVTSTGPCCRTAKATCILAARCWSSCHRAQAIRGKAGNRLPSTAINWASAACSANGSCGRRWALSVISTSCNSAASKM